MSKLTLVGFSRRRVPDPARPGKMMPEARPAFTTCGTTIEAVPSHKFLGVIFDQELQWSEQAERVTAKATKWSLHPTACETSHWGLTMTNVTIISGSGGAKLHVCSRHLVQPCHLKHRQQES